jgi:Family of unknown function (DUF5759)
MISAAEIAERERARRSVRKETYKNILEQFSRKIQACVERRERSATLQVPPLVLGFPMYPYEEALWYLRRQLERSGYQVQQGLEQGQYIVRWDRPSVPRPARKSETRSEPGDDLFSGLANMQKAAEKLRGKY